MQKTLLNAEEIAEILRIKKSTVYEMVKRGELPHTKVGKQIRVTEDDINRFVDNNKPPSPPEPQIQSVREIRESGQSGNVVVCGQDICLDLVISRLSSVCGISALRSYTGSYNSLRALYEGKVTISAAHLWDSETDTYNYPYIPHLLPGLPVGVLRLAGRTQGLYVQKGNPKNIKNWNDFANPEIIMINRERGCGTRVLFDQKMLRLGIDPNTINGYTRESSSHLAVASTVARGGADVGCGCKLSVGNIDFIPLQLEWYDIVFPLSLKNTGAVRELFEYVKSDDFKSDMRTVGEYDLSQTGNYMEFNYKN